MHRQDCVEPWRNIWATCESSCAATPPQKLLDPFSPVVSWSALAHLLIRRLSRSCTRLSRRNTVDLCPRTLPSAWLRSLDGIFGELSSCSRPPKCKGTSYSCIILSSVCFILSGKLLTLRTKILTFPLTTTISHPFKEDQEIPRMDWEDFIRTVRVQILKAQTPESYVAQLQRSFYFIAHLWKPYPDILLKETNFSLFFITKIGCRRSVGRCTNLSTIALNPLRS